MPKHFIPGVLVTLLFTALSCTEGQYTGGSIQPPGDVVSTDTASFFLTTETVKVDSILYKNSVALFGSMFSVDLVKEILKFIPKRNDFFFSFPFVFI